MSETETEEKKTLGYLGMTEEDVTRWPEDADAQAWMGDDAEENFGGDEDAGTV